MAKLDDLGRELRAAFQGGSDDKMMKVLAEDGLRDKLVAALRNADERTLTYSAPFIADLAVRLGQLASSNR
jgi:hypothetical protein